MQPDPELRRRLEGVRGLLVDLDGVLVMRGAVLPGVAEAVAALEASRVPYLIGTNTSLFSRASLARDMSRAGLAVAPQRMVTAASAAAAYCRRHWPGAPLYVMAAPDGRREFEGLCLLSHEEAARPDTAAAAVVVGDAADEFTPRNLLSAFRLLRTGARFVAMHKNRWWLTPEGPTLDAGAYVVGLEYAAERRALVTGKPARTFFLEAVRLLAEEAARDTGGRLAPGDVAMVGDDLWVDIRGAQRAGLRGVLVRSGKHGDAELARAATERPAWAPDAVAPSIGEVISALSQIVEEVAHG